MRITRFNLCFRKLPLAVWGRRDWGTGNKGTSIIAVCVEDTRGQSRDSGNRETWMNFRVMLEVEWTEFHEWTGRQDWEEEGAIKGAIKGRPTFLTWTASWQEAVTEAGEPWGAGWQNWPEDKIGGTCVGAGLEGSPLTLCSASH